MHGMEKQDIKNVNSNIFWMQYYVYINIKSKEQVFLVDKRRKLKIIKQCVKEENKITAKMGDNEI